MANVVISPMLCVKDGDKALAFYQQALGFQIILSFKEPDGKLAHAEMKLGEAVIMLSGEYPDYNALSPETIGSSAFKIHLQVDDVDAVVAKAIEAGAKLIRPAENQFYGHRAGTIEDPFGYQWNVSTLVEEVSNEEITRRFAAFYQ
jgi:PhnB protein